MRIGIMGGTFNPIHNGHIMLAKCALEQFALDRVWFMPSGKPAHKETPELAEGKHRLRMVELAIRGNHGFEASSFELDRPGNTYTADTMMLLTKKYPEDEFFFIIGGDSLMKFHHWVHPEVISAHTTLIAAGRNGFTKEALIDQAELLAITFGTKVMFLDMPEMLISSERIRSSVKQGCPEEIKELLPEAVRNYITEYKLYS